MTFTSPLRTTTDVNDSLEDNDVDDSLEDNDVDDSLKEDDVDKVLDRQADGEDMASENRNTSERIESSWP